MKQQVTTPRRSWPRPHPLPFVVLVVGLGLCALATSTSRHPWLVGTAGVVGSFGAAALLWRELRARREVERRARLLAPDHERLSLLARQTSNAVVVTDASRRITWVNAGFERITGYRLDEVLGRSPGELLQCPATDSQTVQRMREALDRAEPVCCEVLNRAKDGRLYWIEIDLQPMRSDDGRLEGFIAIESDITERRRAEAALQESRALLDRTARIGAIGGWTFDPASTQMQWTDETCRLLGYGPGHRPTLTGFMSHLDADARARVQRELARPIEPGQSWSLELPLRDTRGRELWAHVQAETELGPAGRLHHVGTLQDITARRAMKAEIQRSAALLRGAIDAIDEAFVLYDPDDRLVLCNEKYLELYATSRDLLVPGARFEDIIREGARRGQYQAAIGREDEWVAQRLRAHREARGSGVQRLDDGRIVRVVERLMPDGHRVGFRVDITDLVHASEAAERADRAKSEFIATISHELRTPLQSILGFSDLGRHFARDDARYGPMFQDIHDGGTRMLRLVNGLLDVSKLDGTQGSLELTAGDLGPLLRDVLRELAPLAAQRRLELRLPEPLPPLAASIDSFRAQQVLRNVLANALRFAPEGSEILIRAEVIDDRGVRITVRDFGPGIPEAELETVFEPFLQSSRTRNGAGGTGLGLAICRRIMQAHGGHIVAQLPPDGVGTEMVIDWPAHASSMGAGATGPRHGLRALRQARRPGRADLTSTAEDVTCDTVS